MSEKQVNVAMIGLGFGAEFIPIYQDHPDASVYAICRRNEEQLHKTGDQFQIEKRFTDYDDVLADLSRIMELWAQARARFGGDGDFLFGAFGAVDIMFAPVVTRIVSYQLPVARFAPAYMNAVLQHRWMQDWIAAAQEEDWVIERFEPQAV